jgi:hypothetical protein
MVKVNSRSAHHFVSSLLASFTQFSNSDEAKLLVCSTIRVQLGPRYQSLYVAAGSAGSEIYYIKKISGAAQELSFKHMCTGQMPHN